MTFEFQMDQDAALTQRGLQDGGPVQQFVDSEVLAICEPYIPYDFHILQLSGPLNTDIGSGEVCYNTPYAARQYYLTPDTRSYEPLAGAHWFHRAMADHKDGILKGAAKMAGAKA